MKGVHTADLLEHLVHITQDRSVQVPVLVHYEAILEAALRHLKDGVFDRIELALDCWVIFREVRKSAKYL
jgi:hypothetical protein